MGRHVIEGFPGYSSPAGRDDVYPGIYRGVVEDVEDPQKRKRVRVRVIGVHPDELDTPLLPWAEIACMPAAAQAGDLFPVEQGDRVFVQFEAGDRRHPLVTGFWVARPAGLNDIPSDATVDYSRTQRRWLRIDRVGNTLEMSEVAEESWLRLVSGAAEVVLDQKDGSVTIKTGSGLLRQEVGSCETDARFWAVTADQLIMSAETKDLLGASGILQLMSNFEANLHAEGVVRVGGYLPRYKGVANQAVPGMQFRQSPLVEVRSRALKLGTPVGDVLAGLPAPETESVEVDSVEVLITAAPAVALASGKTVRIVVSAAGDITITSTSKVSISAPEVDVAGATINLTSSTAINLT